ncbi:myosin light chain kinase 2, skeletal/cardiac muscle isoform X2 [Salmo salar]|uniref:Myosin light chain kinase 2, skeletal/cardiac muscle isoform X2 n=1 Tax=Salmo salar TaxID=8030 RepID=A0A1S3LY99_SALSA|nr:myosin light chain kinase 2, skeletal/cardiac muscle isoform X2 [Salmo salar]|eukprot:XP_013995659.1 PREDICTED: myosin light chain kinase 2, skeletal/cardiac muscle-like isoform X2 [Salmo salar]
MSSKIVNSNSTPGKPSTMDNLTDCTGAGLDLIQNRIESLSSKMDRLINIQEKVLNRLDGITQDIDGIERDVETLKVDNEEIHIPARALTLPLAQTQGTGVVGEVREMCHEMSSIMMALDQRSEKQAEKLDGMENLVLSIQQVIRFIGETVKSSRVMEMMFMRPAARKASKSKDSKGKVDVKRQSSAEKSESSITKKTDKSKDHKGKDGKEKSSLSTKGLKTQKKKPPDTADTISLRKQVLLLKEVQKLNRENAERSSSGHQQQLTPDDVLDLEAGSGRASEELGSSQTGSLSPNLLDLILEGPKAPVTEEVSLSEKEREAAGDGLKVEERKEEEEAIKKQEKEDHLIESKFKEEEREEELLKITEQPEEVRGAEEREGNKKEEDSAGPSEVADMSVKDLPSLPPSPEAPGETGSIPESCEVHNKSVSSQFLEAAEQDQMEEGSTSSKRRVTEEDLGVLGVEDHKKSRVEGGAGEEYVRQGEKEQGERQEEVEDGERPDDEDEGWGIFKADGVDIRVELKERMEKEKKPDQSTEVRQSTGEQFFIDKSSPPPAPFNHRIVSAKPNQISNFYTINRAEVLGGGRFGQVHKCMENSSGLTLAAKIIKARSQKEKEVVKNEITVMNQLDHANLIQLYAAYESRNDIILVLEYVDGGELFDRIIDENYTLMELDTVLFIRQICEGLQHMHKMYILHLDLKPENILCVSRVTNKIKIIDFGLARKYKPREKLRINFGTPEFLAPEVVNYDFVSFNTDMWSLGVITYMLLSGLCPFLGDDDNETLNNILACQWNFEEAEFTDISEEAKDFISKLLIINKSWRIGASEALRHPWLSDAVLHHRLHEKKNMCNRSRRSSCVPTTDS